MPIGSGGKLYETMGNATLAAKDAAKVQKLTKEEQKALARYQKNKS
jgi:hypothetical protein